jgi:hypothetical protein
VLNLFVKQINSIILMINKNKILCSLIFLYQLCPIQCFSSTSDILDFAQKKRIQTVFKNQKEVFYLPKLETEKKALDFINGFVDYEKDFWMYQIDELREDMKREEALLCKNFWGKEESITGIFERLLQVTKILDDIENPKKTSTPQQLWDILEEKSNAREIFFNNGRNFLKEKVSKQVSTAFLGFYDLCETSYSILEGYIKVVKLFHKLNTYFDKDFDHSRLLILTTSENTILRNRVSRLSINEVKKTKKQQEPKKVGPTLNSFARFFKNELENLVSLRKCQMTSVVPEIQKQLDKKSFWDVSDFDTVSEIYTQFIDEVVDQVSKNLLAEEKRERLNAIRFFEEEESKTTKKKTKKTKRKNRTLRPSTSTEPNIIDEDFTTQEETHLEPVEHESTQVFVSETDSFEGAPATFTTQDNTVEESEDLTPWTHYEIDKNRLKKKDSPETTSPVAPQITKTLSEEHKHILLAFFSTEHKDVMHNVSMKDYLDLLDFFKGDLTRNGCNLKITAGDSGVVFMHVLHKDKKKNIPRNTYYWKQAKFLLEQIGASKYLKEN